MAELGVPLAPWKTDGPTRCLSFLGLRLCNLPIERSIGLPDDKLQKTLAALRQVKASYRPGDRARPQQVAELLGLLNFASQVVEGGSVFLERMYSQFKGVIVDWKRAMVRVDGRTTHMILDADFFRDVDWWLANLTSRHTVPLLADDRADELVLAGTDASNWGRGAVIWLEGDREKSQHRWTRFEESLPINVRELAGVVHILARWGPRLKGRRLLIESDNMASVSAVKKGRSKAALMAEQLRRLYATAARFDIRVQIVHTPGADLDVPDTESRQRQPTRPRQRLRAEVFAHLEREHGPFDRGMGAEMEHGRLPPEAPATDEDRIWLHPSHASIAATLRRMWEYVAEGQKKPRCSGGRPATGLIVLPAWEDAAWWQLTRGLTVVGRWPPGAKVLEEWRGPQAGWVRVRTLTETCVFAFPAVSDLRLLPVDRYPVQTGDVVAAVTHRGARGSKTGPSAEHVGLYLVADSQEPAPDGFLVGLHLVRLSEASRRQRKDRSATHEQAADTVGWELPIDSLYKVTRWAREASGGSSLYQVSFPAEQFDKLFLGQEAAPAEADEAHAPAKLLATHESVEHAGPGECPCCGVVFDGSACSRVSLAGDTTEQTWVHTSCVPELEDMVARVVRQGTDEQSASSAPAPARSFQVARHVSRFGPEHGQGSCGHCGTMLGPEPAAYVVWRDTPGLGAWMHARCLAAAGEQRAESPVRAGLLREAFEAQQAERQRRVVAASPKKGEGGTTARGAPGDSSRRLFAEDDGLAVSGAGRKTRQQSSGTKAVPEAAAGKKHALEAGKSKLMTVEPDRRGAGTTRGARNREVTGARRVQLAVACLADKCGLREGRDVQCMGCAEATECGVAVHSHCFGLSQAQVAANLFLCPSCRFEGLTFAENADPAQVQQVKEDVLVDCIRDVDAPAVGTVRVMEQVAKKIVAFEAEKGLERTMNTPANLRQFGDWLISNGCPGSADLYVRIAGQMGSHKPGAGGEDAAKSAIVRRWRRQASKRLGDDVDSDTPLPLVMYLKAKEMLLKKGKLVGARNAFALTAEFQGGCRVSEVAGAGEGHGLECGPDYTRIYSNRVECRLDHRKASDTAEFVTMARDTKNSNIDAGLEIKAMAEKWGRQLKLGRTETGEIYEYVDYHVVRLNLRGAAEAEIDALSKDAAGRFANGHQRRHLISEAKRRAAHQNTNLRYLNVEGGTLAEMLEAVEWWRRRHSQWEVEVVAGPLLCSTTRGSRGEKGSDQPWTPASLASELKEVFEAVFLEVVSSDVAEAAGATSSASELVGQLAALPANIKGPKWNSHSCRRGGTKLAMELRDKSGASKDDVDRHYGWLTKKNNTRRQQAHYAGMLPAQQRINVTLHF